MRSLTACPVLAFAVLCAGLASCEMSSAMLRSTPPMELHWNDGEMKAEVLAHVPVGMPIDEARRAMKTHGFKCRYDRDPWVEYREGVDPARVGEVYLICSKFKPERHWLNNFFMSYEIEVFFSIEDGKVREVRVEHHSTCI